jgi:Arc/MetJ-type ribon-helix-helix transcriptional regulator
MVEEHQENARDVLIRLSETMLAEIEDVRFSRRFKSRVEAIRFLIERGLESIKNDKPGEQGKIAKS